MRLHEKELDDLGVKVVVVTFQAGPLADAYGRETELSWPLLVDDTLSLYRAYGIERGRLWDIWGPASWGAYAKLLSRGRKMKAPAGDVNQLGGDVLVDPQGIVRMHHIGSGPADRPPVSQLLDVIRQQGSANAEGAS